MKGVRPIPLRTIRWVSLGVFLLVIVFSAGAQNTKGDRPQPNQKQVRETRKKSIVRKESGTTKDASGRRLRTKNKSSISRRAIAPYLQTNPYAGRRRVNNDVPARARQRVAPARPSERQRAWSGDISGSPVRKVQPRKAEVARVSRYPERSPNVSSRPTERKTFRSSGKTASGNPIVRRVPQPATRAWQGDRRGRPISVRSATGKTRNVFPQRNPFSAVGRFPQPSGKPKKFWYRGLFARVVSSPASRLSGQRQPLSVSSRSHVTPGRKNVYWGKEQRKERAVSTDLAGRPLRSRNFVSAKPALARQDTLRDFRRSPKSAQLRWGKRAGAVSATRSGRPWKGDIAGRPVRSRFAKISQNAGKPVAPIFSRRGGRSGRGLNLFSRNRSATGASSIDRFWNNQNRSVSMNRAGMGTVQGARASGAIRAWRPLKEGGSISGRNWNNRGRSVNVFKAGVGTVQGARSAGTIRSWRPPKEGGSVSGRIWNNRGNSVSLFRAGMGTVQGARSTGTIRSWRPPKEGGSVSSSPRNNRGQPIDARRPGIGTVRGALFSGTIRSGRREQGGGSVSARSRNNGGQPVDVRRPGMGSVRGAQFSGSIKTRRPEKGGGSVSARSRNNGGLPVDVRRPGMGSVRGAQFSGSIKTSRPEKGGGSVSARSRNNGGLPVDVRRPGMGTVRGAQFSGTLKTRRPEQGGGSVSGRLWNNEERPLDPHLPSGTTVKMARFSGFSRTDPRTRQRFSYRHNPVSHPLALDAKYFGKAYARIENYKGEIRIKRYADGRLHPDARFAHGRPSTQPENRSFITNMKLWWTRNFRKSELQPDHLKAKMKKPRYDKREIGLWYD